MDIALLDAYKTIQSLVTDAHEMNACNYIKSRRNIDCVMLDWFLKCVIYSSSSVCKDQYDLIAE